MKKEKIEEAVKASEAMTPEEFVKAYYPEGTVIPSAESEEEARYIVEHSGIDDESSKPNATRWFDNIMEGFCVENAVVEGEDTQTLFQIVGWEDDVTYSADITVYFRDKRIAEKFAKIIYEDVYCTIPNMNFNSEYRSELYEGLENDVRVVPIGIREYPYLVNWYVDVREALIFKGGMDDETK